MRTRATRTAIITLSVVGVVLCVAPPVRAQAWVPPKGEASVSFVAQDALAKYHIFSAGEREDIGQVRSHAILMSLTYSLTDRIAVSVSLPYDVSKYNGDFPHQDPAVNPIDGGAYHGTFQDVRVGFLYNVTTRHLAVTPFVGSIVPSHNYEYFAHSAAGRDLRELQVGAFVGRLLGSVFIQGRYAYGFTQRVGAFPNISNTRSLLNLDAGYFVKRSLRVFALAQAQVTHGGIDIPWPTPRIALGSLFPYHDQLARDNHVNAGGGTSWSVSDSIEMFGSIVRTVFMRNGHALSYSLSIGITYTFAKGAQSRAESAANHEATGDSCPIDGSNEKTSLSKCACMKGG
jgi:hypothetical protein